ncbi:MAG: hypothetical protein HLUCCA12_04860 [Rhodobacteraceae bacterium HLUCCA12]|jgi:hypothetical protein|nr:MAG: hypothetical protein HLUCCA12_04860 [Rhodobacteraceae bacterium HLUCCA12]
MSEAKMIIRCVVAETDVPRFKDANLFIRPYFPDQHAAIVDALDGLEQFVSTCDDAAVKARFQVLQAFFNGAMTTGPGDFQELHLPTQTEARRFDA